MTAIQPISAANQTCRDGVCGCYYPWGNCDSNMGNGCETDLSRSGEHCGSCTNRCRFDDYCDNGSCEPV